LSNVLTAFKASRPDIGYLQGMSFIAAVLLLFFEEFQTFVFFSNLITFETLMPMFTMDLKIIKERFLKFETYFKN